MDRECDGDTNRNWCVKYCHQSICTETGGLRNKPTSGDHPNYSIEPWRFEKLIVMKE